MRYPSRPQERGVEPPPERQVGGAFISTDGEAIAFESLSATAEGTHSGPAPWTDRKSVCPGDADLDDVRELAKLASVRITDLHGEGLWQLGCFDDPWPHAVRFRLKSATSDSASLRCIEMPEDWGERELWLGA